MGNCNDNGNGNGNTKVIVGCTELQFYSPKGTIEVTKISKCSYQLTLAGTGAPIPEVIAQDGATTTVEGNGRAATPIITEVKLADLPTNAITVSPAGLFASGVALSAADNGLRVEGTLVRLGDPVLFGYARFYSNREIPMGGFNLLFSGTGNVAIGSLNAFSRLDVYGTMRSTALAGVGVRMVNTAANGILGVQAFPVYAPTEKVFYVSKKYTGIGSATVTGTTLANISSINASYNTQLAAAQMGSLEKTYPDPWSARNAAMDALIAGTITTANIVVLPGNTYTVGSDVNSNNGSATSPYLTTADDASDIRFSAANSFAICSLVQNKVYVEFKETSGLYNICHTYNIFLIYQDDPTDTKFRGGILGRGFFHRLYGVNNSFHDMIIWVDNANATVEFNAKEVSQSSGKGICIWNCADVYVNVDTYYSADTSILQMTCLRATTQYNKVSNISVKIRTLIQGYQQTLYTNSENGGTVTKFLHGVNLFPQIVQIDITNMTTAVAGLTNIPHLIQMDYTMYPYLYGGSVEQRVVGNLTFLFRVENYTEIKRNPVVTLDMGPSVKLQMASRTATVPGTSTSLANNIRVLIELKKATLVCPMLTGTSGIISEGINNLFTIKSDKLVKDNTDCTKPLFNVEFMQGQAVADRTNIVFDGWFEDRQSDMFAGHAGSTTTGGYVRITLRGRFVARTAGKIIIKAIPNTTNKVNYILDGAVLINDGTTSLITSAVANTEIVCISAVANSVPDANTIVKGNGITYDSIVADYY